MTTDTQGQKEGSILNVRNECVQPPVGVIDATIARTLDQVEGKLDWKYLKAGEVMEVPSGKAYITKHPTHYLKVQFFEPGSMTGPVVFSETEIEDPRIAVEHSFSVVDYFLAPAVAVMFGAVFYIMTTISDEDTSRTTIISFITLATLAVTLGVIYLAKNAPVFIEGGEKAIEFMTKRKVLLREHPVSIDTECLSEIKPEDSKD